MDWRHEAACRDKDPDIFFPDGSASTAPIEVAMAKAVCRNCPVARRCLEWAIDTEQADGIWGAMTVRERRKVAKRLVALPERRSAQSGQSTPESAQVIGQVGLTGDLGRFFTASAPKGRADACAAGRRG